MPAEKVWPRGVSACMRRQPLGGVLDPGAGQEQAELLAAVAGEQLTGPEQRGPGRDGLAEQQVPGLVAVRVVEALEVVEVQQGHR